MTAKLVKFIGILLMLWIIVLFPLGIESENLVQKRGLTHEDYNSWKSIINSKISGDGNWILYIETPQEGEASIVVKNSNSVKKEFRHSVGYSGIETDSKRTVSPSFSYDSSHVFFLISPSQEEIVKAKKDKKNKKKPKMRLGIMSLADGKVVIVENVKSYKIPKEAGSWVAYLMEKDPDKEKKEKQEKEEVSKEETKKAVEKKKEETLAKKKKKGEPEKKEEEKDKKKKKKKFGTQLILYSLSNGTKINFESVANYTLTNNGTYLYYTVSSEKKPESDGCYMVKTGEEKSIALVSGEGNYKRLVFDKKQTKMAFLSDHEDYQSDTPTFNLYGGSVGEQKATLLVSHTSNPDFPKGMAVSDKSKIIFSEDGKVMMFGIKELPPSPKKEEKEGEQEDKDVKKAVFDLWHWNDPYPQPQQKKMASRVKDNTWETVYHFSSKKLVKLADETVPDLQLSRDGSIGFARSIWPYTKQIAYDGSYYDIYTINIETGQKTLIKKKVFRRASLSPGAKYIYWFEGKDWFVYDIKNKSEKNITKSLNIRFDREDWDTPSPPNGYGVAGWLKNDKAILVYDQYDIWEISPDGKQSRMITEGEGRKNNLSFRYLRTNPEEYFIPSDKSLLLRTTNIETMDGGFYSDQIKGTKIPKKLILLPKSFSYPRKAKNADKLIFSQSSFDEYPDLWISDIKFVNKKKMTNLGIQMKPFIWGKAELRDFSNSDGKKLKGILIKPSNFDPNKKYPLMLYIYETLHQGLHRYRHPSPGSSVNPSFYTSNGYVIWMPDIEYGTGYPGKDALKCVLPGINMLIEEGYIDKEAIGIQGHSWGGYQIAYMITQTNIFSAVEAGAPVSNMTSAYGGIRWASGMVRQFQYEKTQSRLGASLWEVPMRYFENSPIFWADKVQTPIMMMHNDNDGAVPWYQGIEYIMALRRLNKEAYMFNYNGEGHGLRKRVNQIDWTKRMYDFFEHHLRGAKAPDWMVNGIKAWDKKENNKEKD